MGGVEGEAPEGIVIKPDNAPTDSPALLVPVRHGQCRRCGTKTRMATFLTKSRAARWPAYNTRSGVPVASTNNGQEPRYRESEIGPIRNLETCQSLEGVLRAGALQ